MQSAAERFRVTKIMLSMRTLLILTLVAKDSWLS
uniref:Uncharacterized protein n=1 Tax=Arundo donax TaxID=35708 RepID=A0A0A8YEB6_ARUDO